jgi:hypothetical protein
VIYSRKEKMEIENIAVLMNELGIDRAQLHQYSMLTGYQLTTFQKEMDLSDANKIRKFHEFASIYPPTMWPYYANIESNLYSENPFQQEIENSLFQEQIIHQKVSHNVIFNEESFESTLSDFQASSICLGLENKRARNLSRDFLNKGNEDVLAEIHYYAHKTLEKYGNEVVAFLLTLPPLPFTIPEFEEAFSELDKRRNLKKFPAYRLIYRNKDGQANKIFMSFYTKTDNGDKRVNKDLIQIKNSTTGKSIFYINRKGRVFPAENTKEIVPIIKLFLRFSKDSESMIINYGHETGECSDCGRKLTDIISVKLGRGPICRRSSKGEKSFS